ncbi:MAG: hypothetical protein AAF170_10080 [Bacteroidota bacterium]
MSVLAPLNSLTSSAPDDDTRSLLVVGDTPVHTETPPVDGSFVNLDGHAAYRIDNVDRMDPFFVTVVSDSDHWLFASSTGGLTAGRRSPDHALFPYETVDRLHDAQDKTGSKTVLLVTRNANGGDGAAGSVQTALWEPFSDRHDGLYAIRRSLTKTLQGDRLRYEEINDDLGLTFALTWATSETYGFVKTSELTAHREGVSVRVLDGVQNLMPYGLIRDLQAIRSNLADAYKKNELVPDTPLGLFLLSAIPVDRAEPSEALKATTVWSAGIEPDAILLSTRQLDRFRAGLPVETETAIRAERGAYFIAATVELGSGEATSWDLVADIEQDAADVIELAEALVTPATLREALHANIEAGTERLHQLVAGADGEQATGEPMTAARHRMNVLFNIMRGGIFDEGYSVVRDDVRAYVAHHNAPLAHAHADRFNALPERLRVRDLMAMASDAGPQLERLCLTYLPLSFSRRHGDPSRPWNHFTIEIKTEEGAWKRGYEGNWRDIFQNWEALSRSYPGYLESIITTFVNASTADGYNPYRITADGIDWESIEPDDPWSYIGYWGDHQLIYLLRLLVMSRQHHPGQLERLLSRRLFSYANVPYRIKPYADLLRDPHDTVLFDAELEAAIEERVAAVGADGKLLWDENGNVRLVTLAEKLLVPLLAKLTNFIPEGGVWMNTQRPEWNDANNALVGYGVSMVTLFALRRTLTLFQNLFADAPDDTAELSVEVADLLDAVSAAFAEHEALADRALTDVERKQVVDALGRAGEAYREVIYTDGFSGDTRAVSMEAVQDLLSRSQAFADHTIAVNRREDGLFNAYNLMAASDDEVAVSHLYPMLEGQVAALDAGVLSPEASLDVLKALRASDIYRPDQHSYRLYPDRELPSFLNKNNVPAEAVEASPLLQTLIADGDRALVVQDVRGGVHFNGAFRNKTDVQAALDRLRQLGYAEAVDRDGQGVLDAFEQVFDHRSYTGRSGTFFGFEGLGSIYWHMVSKLALATMETTLRAHKQGAGADVLCDLADAYYDIRAGLGVAKTPEEFGAFPADAYSHTPGHAGAKQPGMTGQVKEDILCRWGELGVIVESGQIAFRPVVLRADEFLTTPTPFHFVDVRGQAQTLELAADQLGFTYCQVPVVYTRSEAPFLRIARADGSISDVQGDALPPDASSEIFRRTGAIVRIEVGLPPGR